MFQVILEKQGQIVEGQAILCMNSVFLSSKNNFIPKTFVTKLAQNVENIRYIIHIIMYFSEDNHKVETFGLMPIIEVLMCNPFLTIIEARFNIFVIQVLCI